MSMILSISNASDIISLPSPSGIRPARRTLLGADCRSQVYFGRSQGQVFRERASSTVPSRMVRMAVMSRAPCSGWSRAPSIKVPLALPRSASPIRVPATISLACGWLTEASAMVSSAGFAAGAPVSSQVEAESSKPSCRAVPSASLPASRQPRLSGSALGGAAKAGGATGTGRPPAKAATGASSRGQRMKAKTQSSISGTIVPTAVSVSSTAPRPVQPGRPALATMRQAIHAKSMNATMAKALVRPARPNRAAISVPISAISLTRFAVRPVAEGQDRHDDERADERDEMQQRPGARVTRACADLPGRDDQDQRQQQMADEQDQQQEGADAHQPGQPRQQEEHDLRQAPQPRSRPSRRAASAPLRPSSVPEDWGQNIPAGRKPRSWRRNCSCP